MRKAVRVAAKAVSVISLAVTTLMAVSVALVIAAPSLKPFPVGFAFDLGDRLAGPFENIFATRDLDLYVFANWGLAAVVWLAAGQLLALLLRRASDRPRGRDARPEYH